MIELFLSSMFYKVLINVSIFILIYYSFSKLFYIYLYLFKSLTIDENKDISNLFGICITILLYIFKVV